MSTDLVLFKLLDTKYNWNMLETKTDKIDLFTVSASVTIQTNNGNSYRVNYYYDYYYYYSTTLWI